MFITSAAIWSRLVIRVGIAPTKFIPCLISSSFYNIKWWWTFRNLLDSKNEICFTAISRIQTKCWVYTACPSLPLLPSPITVSIAIFPTLHALKAQQLIFVPIATTIPLCYSNIMRTDGITKTAFKVHPMGLSFCISIIGCCIQRYCSWLVLNWSWLFNCWTICFTRCILSRL